MATNLRLQPEAAQALRAEAQRSGRSQQDVIRTAIERYLALVGADDAPGDVEALAGTGAIKPPRVPYRKPRRRLVLPAGTTTADLLEREDRM